MGKIIVKEKLRSGEVITHQYNDGPGELRKWNQMKGKKLLVGKGGKIISAKKQKTNTTPRDPIRNFLGGY
jgi:hypothetical protein